VNGESLQRPAFYFCPPCFISPSSGGAFAIHFSSCAVIRVVGGQPM
jgi:hypothetical protein